MEDLQYKVTHYGNLISQTDIKVGEKFITIKIWEYLFSQYEGSKQYIEVWDTGKCILFDETEF